MLNLVRSVIVTIKTVSSTQQLVKANFSEVQLKENLQALYALNKAKPTTAKGIFIKKVSISTTMGAGVAVDQSFTIIKR